MSDTMNQDIGGLPRAVPSVAELQSWLRRPVGEMLRAAADIRDRSFGHQISYSRKVFIPLTELCRDVCHYCTFAKAPSRVAAPYMSLEEVLSVARLGLAAGCNEALLTLGEKPELRYQAARDWLDGHGYESTLDYLHDVCAAIVKETGLLPHVNAGTMEPAMLARLRAVSPSMGLMLESASERLCQRGMPHFGSPDKLPAARLDTLRAAGELSIPVTTGLLIGIGETWEERIEALLALRALHEQYGHIQEVIIQNFRAKPGTRMEQAPEPGHEEFLRAIALARIALGESGISLQAPPNLAQGDLGDLVRAGINDWGGVSPVTPDYVNPESPWPHLDRLEAQTMRAGKTLVQRLTVYPRYVQAHERWVDKQMVPLVLRRSDAQGLARECLWVAGSSASIDRAPPRRSSGDTVPEEVRDAVRQAREGGRLDPRAIERLFSVRGAELDYVCRQADALRSEVCGDEVSYVVTRNINYTNVCTYGCAFCAFSKGKTHEKLRGSPYNLSHEEIARRVREAWDRGATEVCMQGGIHPDYTGHTYLEILRVVKETEPRMHVHAFSPLEVVQGARTLGLGLREYLTCLKDAGLGSLPGTAAEILHDDVRALICPGKLTTREWVEAIETAHEVGLRTTSTIMYGHVEEPRHWAEHLLVLRDLQARTGGITEFVPLPFVGIEAPLYLRGRSRPGPTWREALLMHAIGRLVLHPLIPNIQASWVKLGHEGVQQALAAGVNDLGGTLMNESITRAAGAKHGQETAPQALDALIVAAGRKPRQRNTLYAAAPQEQVRQSYKAAALSPIINTPLARRRRPAVLASAGGH
ncbi:5-amino-6-(D-ribitylamino)uracil--L-tyrosine 4-hydroxyphenyl transferase CofH [Alcaligenaceae bacterium]|nr:5-amino-6-(D-ribitylamino)uracil--L-tyrosine 4-hydroxyphenyl transferase CofH [Alcaligenaceae bacterium]